MTETAGVVDPFVVSGGMLDVLASAVRAGLDATAVIIGCGSARDWEVVGSTRAANDPKTLRMGDGQVLEAGGLAAVRLGVDEGGGLLRAVPAPAAGDGHRWAATAEGPGGSVVLLVVEGLGGSDLHRRLPLFAAVAAQGVAAVDVERRDRVRESLREREEERRRWARELHDETLQQLGALHVLLRSAVVPSSADGTAAHDCGAVLGQAADLVGDQIGALRHLINDLRPAALDELGLRPPLEAFAERTEALTGFRVEMDVSLPYAEGRMSTRLLPDVELAVYRVVQEAVTNAARHSGGSGVRVVICEQDGDVRVTVSDDGAANGRLTGFGIDGMRERAGLAGGHLEVVAGETSAGQRGTVVRMVVPARHRSAHGEQDDPDG